MGKPSTAAAPEVHLGAFGKHPGWNDHIDDLGLETQLLVDFKTLVYMEGVAKMLESGRWDNLEPDSRIDDIAHICLFRTRGELLLARMWTSRDGKGRTRYPMVIVAQVRGVPLEWALSTILPELESMQKRCEAATKAQEVISIMDSGRSALRARAAAVASDKDGGNGPELVIPAAFLPQIADRPEMGPKRQGLYRILYEAQREMGLYVRSKHPQSKFGRTDHVPSVQLRLPALAVASGDVSGVGAGAVGGLLTAVRLLLSRLESWTPMLLIASLKHPIVDVILGEPQGPQLFCLQAGEKALPLTTQIPYTIDDAFIAQTDAWIASQSAVGDLAVMPASESNARRSGVGRFLLLALAAVAAVAASNPAIAAAGQPPATNVPTEAEPRQRYNDALANLKLAVMNPDAPDEQIAVTARKFIADVSALPGGVAYLSDVQRTLTAIDRAVDNKDAGVVSADVLRFGPGSLASYTGSAEGEILRFKAAAEGLPDLAFARIETAGGAAVYLGLTEVSVGQFGAIISTKVVPTDLPKVFLNKFTRVNDSRLGPRSWEWGETVGGKPTIVPAGAWLIRMGLGRPTDYPPGAEPSPPSLDSPMDYLSPHAALLAARLVGCRLPTVAEWAAAKAKYAAALPQGAANLRDETWRIQFDHAKAMEAQGAKSQRPDAGAFLPVGITPKNAANNWNDTNLWFTRVQVGGGEIVHNLIGNVAEFVIDAPSADQPEPRAAPVADFVGAPSTKVRVIGGSALSDLAVDPATPQPVMLAEAQEGYADVGFRLAFSAGVVGGQSLAARLNRLLEPLPIIR